MSGKRGSFDWVPSWEQGVRKDERKFMTPDQARKAYGGGDNNEGQCSYVDGRDSLERSLGDVPKRGVIGENDTQKIYKIASANLAERREQGLKCISWRQVVSKVRSVLPHLERAPLSGIKNAYLSMRSDTERCGGRDGRKETYFTPEMLDCLYEIGTKHVDPESSKGRVKYRHWGAIRAEFIKKYFLAAQASMTTLRSTFRREQGKREKKGL